MSVLGVIGVGNIAGAILTGAINSGYITPDGILIYDIDERKTREFSEKYGIEIAECAEDTVQRSDYVLLAVKPGAMEQLLKTIAPFAGGRCIISVAAGISTGFISTLLTDGCAVVRAMPNTPLTVGQGAVAVAKNAAVSDGEFNFVKGLFASCGYVCEVAEENLNAVTAVSGSSPAFVFRFIKNMIDEAVNEGLSYETAAGLVLQTVIGSAVMFRDGGKSADELIRMVASPNGTTEAGLKALDGDNFDLAVRNAVAAAFARSKELAR